MSPHRVTRTHATMQQRVAKEIATDTSEESTYRNEKETHWTCINRPSV